MYMLYVTVCYEMLLFYWYVIVTWATPLHWASMNGHVEVVKLLIDNQADVSATNVSDYVVAVFIIVYNLVGRVINKICIQ